MSFDNRRWRFGRELASGDADTAPAIAALRPGTLTAPLAEQGASGVINVKGMEVIHARHFGIGAAATSFIVNYVGWCQNGPGLILVEATSSLSTNVFATAALLLGPDQEVTSQVWREGDSTLADNVAVATEIEGVTVENSILTLPTLGFPFIQIFISDFSTATRAAVIWRPHKWLSHK